MNHNAFEFFWVASYTDYELDLYKKFEVSSPQDFNSECQIWSLRNIVFTCVTIAACFQAEEIALECIIFYNKCLHIEVTARFSRKKN